MGEVEQLQAAEIVAKPVAEEQAIVSQILRQQLHNPAYERQEVQELRKFLKRPLVGASVQKLRDTTKIYSNMGDETFAVRVTGNIEGDFIYIREGNVMINIIRVCFIYLKRVPSV